MSKPILYGTGVSNFVRSCRLTLEEKGVAYDQVELFPDAPEVAERHPFKKIPSFEHGEVRLFESLAICDYVDSAFDGPKVIPTDPAERGAALAWAISYIHYLDGPIIREIVIQRLVVPSRGGQTDEAVVKAAVPVAAERLAVVDRQIGTSGFIVGSSPTVADFFLLPAVSYLKMTPEGPEVLSNLANVNAWYDRLAARPSAAAIGIAA